MPSAPNSVGRGENAHSARSPGHYGQPTIPSIQRRQTYSEKIGMEKFASDASLESPCGYKQLGAMNMENQQAVVCRRMSASKNLLSPAIRRSKEMVLRRTLTKEQHDFATPLIATPLISRIHENISKVSRSKDREPIVHGTLYGIINSIALVPVLVSYIHIVFNSHKEFGEYIPRLVKTMFLSSAIHQLVFSWRSAMPFAVGQVQDVGLIFLSAMVRGILSEGSKLGIPKDEVVATCLWMCAFSTGLVGLVVWGVGKAQIAEYVQLIPLPVVGGYLGYIGYFCVAAGLSITTGEFIAGPETWGVIFNEVYLWRLVFMTGLVLTLFLMHAYGGAFGLPTALLGIPVFFFIALSSCGISMTDAQTSGWLPPPADLGNFWTTLELYDPTLVHWKLFLQQIPNLVGLCVVVTFGSSLDIAAVQADYTEVLDYNREMKTVGLANLLSGLFGGYSGSYIFSQTVFSLKMNVRSKANGYIVFAVELICALFPIDVVRYLPLGYVGSIMTFFGIAIMKDWLVDAYSLVSWVEFLLIYLSFFVVLYLSGLNSFGLLLGLVLSTFCAALVFTFLYASVRTWREVETYSSSVVRSSEAAKKLHENRDRIVIIRIFGYVFFGHAMDLIRLQRMLEKSSAQYVIIDFARCDGVDSSAASAFGVISTILSRKGCYTYLTAAHGDIDKVLRSHSSIEAPVTEFYGSDFLSMDGALKICEDIILGHPSIASSKEIDLPSFLYTNIKATECGDRRGVIEWDLREDCKNLATYFEIKNIPAGDMLFSCKDKPKNIYFILKGIIETTRCRVGLEANFNYVTTVIPGTILGDISYFSTEGTAGYDAKSVSECTIGIIDRQTLELLEREHPKLLVLMQKTILYHISCYATQSLREVYV